MTDYHFIEPLDVLHLRGNKLFGDAGTHGEALMPPWPSLIAGALRSHLLADHGVDFNAFANSTATLDPALATCLGTPANPGNFRIAAFTLAQRQNGTVEPCFPLPADVIVHDQGDAQQCHYLYPRVLAPQLLSGYPLSELPILATSDQFKPASGYWLNSIGLTAYLAGQPLTASHLIKTDRLWQLDSRLGIALDSHRRTAAESRLYTTEAVALCQDAGFLAGLQGTNGLLPQNGLLRFGGDGRAAKLSAVSITWPQPDWQRIERERCFRLILATPGLFAAGWQLPGLTADHSWQIPPTGNARLVAAAVNRAEIISGWNLANWQPKPAQRVAPVGSVYSFRDFDGDVAALQTLMAAGLTDELDPARRAEGFNNILIAAWPRQ